MRKRIVLVCWLLVLPAFGQPALPRDGLPAAVPGPAVPGPLPTGGNTRPSPSGSVVPDAQDTGELRPTQLDLTNPNVKPPATFRGTDPAQTANLESIGNLNWFELFRDPQLQDLIRVALVQNFDLNTALLRVQASRANLGLISAAQWPSLGLSADNTFTQQSTKSPNFVPGFLARSRSFGEVLLNLLSFELDIWGRVRNQVDAAEAQLEGVNEDRKTVMTMVVSQVATAYFNLLELDGELAVDQKTLESRSESLRIIRLRQQGGVATLLDVRQGEQLVELATVAIVDTRRQIEQTENNLNLLLGRDPGPISRGTPLTAQYEVPTVPPGLPSELLRRRPDIRAAERAIAAQTSLLAVARKAYFPTISLTGYLGFQSTALSSLFRGGSITSSFEPQIGIGLLDGGRLHSQELQALANQTLSIIRYRQVVATALNEVSNALVQYARIKEVRMGQDQLVATITDRTRLAYLRYRGGVDTLLAALDADRDLFTAQVGLAQARRNELLAMVQLYRALGGGWQPVSEDAGRAPVPVGAPVPSATPASTEPIP